MYSNSPTLKALPHLAPRQLSAPISRFHETEAISLWLSSIEIGCKIVLVLDFEIKQNAFSRLASE